MNMNSTEAERFEKGKSICELYATRRFSIHLIYNLSIYIPVQFVLLSKNKLHPLLFSFSLTSTHPA